MITTDGAIWKICLKSCKGKQSLFTFDFSTSKYSQRCLKVVHYCLKVVSMSSYSHFKLSLSCPKVIQKWYEGCLKVVPKVARWSRKKCLKVVPKLSQSCHKIVPKYSLSCRKVVSNLFLVVPSFAHVFPNPKWCEVVFISIKIRPRNVLSERL